MTSDMKGILYSWGKQQTPDLQFKFPDRAI